MTEKFIIKHRKALFIIGVLVLLMGCGIPDFYYRFIFIGIVNFSLGYFLRKINPLGKIGLCFIYFYFFLITPVIVYKLCIGELIPRVIGFIIYLVSCGFAYIVYKSHRKLLYTAIYLAVFVVLTLNHNNMMNYYYDMVLPQNKNIGKPVPAIKIHDYKGKVHVIKGNGKIQVVDLWSNSCRYSIDRFLKFEKLKNNYKNDKEVVFYAVNIKLGRHKNEDMKEANEYIKKYSYDNYFTDEDLYDKLNLLGTPGYMIISKDGKIKYIGRLNIGKTETYHNIYDLIENEK